MFSLARGLGNAKNKGLCAPCMYSKSSRSHQALPTYTQKVAPFTPPLRDTTTLGIAPRVSHDSIAPAASHRRTQHDMRTPCTPSFTRTAIRSVHTHAQSLCSHSSMHTPNTQHIRPRPAPGTRDHRRVHGGPNSPSGTPPCAPPCPPPCGPQPGAGSGASRAGMPAGRGMAASGSGGGPAADGAPCHTSPCKLKSHRGTLGGGPTQIRSVV